MTAIGFDIEGSHDRLGWANRAYFEDHTPVDRALTIKQSKVELECVDRALGIIPNDERQSAVILLQAFRRVELDMASWVGGRNRCNSHRP